MRAIFYPVFLPQYIPKIKITTLITTYSACLQNLYSFSVDRIYDHYFPQVKMRFCKLYLKLDPCPLCSSPHTKLIPVLHDHLGCLLSLLLPQITSWPVLKFPLLVHFDWVCPSSQWCNDLSWRALSLAYLSCTSILWEKLDLGLLPLTDVSSSAVLLLSPSVFEYRQLNVWLWCE